MTIGLIQTPSNTTLLIQSKDQSADPAQVATVLPTQLRQIESWSQTVGLLNGFVGTPLVGTNPPNITSNALLGGADNPTVTFTAGSAPVTFLTPFAHGVMYISVTNIQGGADVWSISNYTLTGFTLHSSAGGTGNEQISYYVVGW